MENQKQKQPETYSQFENYSPGHAITPDVKKKRFIKINAWLHKYRILVLSIIVFVCLVIGGGLIYGFSHLTFFSTTGEAIVLKKEVKIYSELTGLEVSETDSKRPVTAIMIENSPDARPQSGLKDSGVVFEAIAEGGITRFLTLHQEDQPELIGPVRSLRPYYVDWLAAFDPSVAHVGGSVKALSEIRNGKYKDIDQFFNASTYWRATDRYAPHNVYTSFDKLNALNKAKGYTTSKFTGFTRVEEIPIKKTSTGTRSKSTRGSSDQSATSINVSISGPLYDSSYTYDSITKLYTRSQAGKIHLDREKGAITPKVVIVIESPVSQVLEDGYREQYKTIGSGKATIFQNGVAIVGTWSKNSKTDQIKFKDNNNKPIKLERGQTWITVIDPSKSVTWN